MNCFMAGAAPHPFFLPDAMTELEGGAGCVLYPCGAAAVANAILAFVTSGDHILVSGAVYEPTEILHQNSREA